MANKDEGKGIQFAAVVDKTEQKIRARTYGLVTLEQLKAAHEEAEVERHLDAPEPEASPDAAVKRKKIIQKAVVSFNMDDEDEDGGDGGGGSGGNNGKSGGKSGVKEKEKLKQPTGASERKSEDVVVVVKKKLAKDPGVDTSFLPDRERDVREYEDRKRLQMQWMEMQRKIKDEPLTLRFSYFDGAGHRRELTVKKGTTITEFLQAVLVSLRPEVPELRAVSADQLLFIKGEIILPPSRTFHQLISSKTRGRGGLLFRTADDEVFNPGFEEAGGLGEEGKVVLRRWYEHNKSNYPASRWIFYDPTKHSEDQGEVDTAPMNGGSSGGGGSGGGSGGSGSGGSGGSVQTLPSGVFSGKDLATFGK